MSGVPLVNPNDVGPRDVGARVFGSQEPVVAGRYGNRQFLDAPAPQQVAEPQYGYIAPAAGKASADLGGNTRTIEVPLSFSWTGPKTQLTVDSAAFASEVQALATKKNPLVDALKQLNLSLDEGFHIANTHLKKVWSNSPSEIGVLLKGVNARDLAVSSPAGQSATFTILPKQSKDYATPEHPHGLTLQQSSLDSAASVNIKLSPNEMLKAIESDPRDPSKALVDLNLLGFASSHDDGVDQLSPLGRLVVANATAKLKASPIVPNQIKSNIPDQDYSGTDMLPDIQIGPHAFDEGNFIAKVTRKDLENLVHHYKQNNSAEAHATSAHDHSVEVFRVGALPGEHIGDLSNEIGVSATEADRAKHVTTGVRFTLVYTLQHNNVAAKK